jgi:hypothetical protein
MHGLWLLQHHTNLEALLVQMFMPPIKANDTPYLDGIA